MPALKNPRQEKFAQALAKGEEQMAAYRAAGYLGSSKSVASELAAKSEVKARIAELLQGAAARTEITVAGVTKRLLAIADKAEKDANGTPGLGVARQALMDVAKLNGMIIDKTQRELSEEQMKILLDMVKSKPGMAEQLLSQLA